MKNRIKELEENSKFMLKNSQFKDARIYDLESSKFSYFSFFFSPQSLNLPFFEKKKKKPGLAESNQRELSLTALLNFNKDSSQSSSSVPPSRQLQKEVQEAHQLLAIEKMVCFFKTENKNKPNQTNQPTK